ncbi:MAG: LuxR C-terminal-related transcriptional regulator [Phycisphaerales bacterium]
MSEKMSEFFGSAGRSFASMRSDDLVRLIFDEPDTAVGLLDETGRILRTNRIAARLFENEPRIEGQRLNDILPADYAEERVEFINQALDTNERIDVLSMFRGELFLTSWVPLQSVEIGHSVVLARSRPVPKRPDSDTRLVYARKNDLGPLARLTPGELEVLTMIGMGMTTPAIAQRLNRKEKTIEWRRASLGKKLQVTTRVELASIAIRAGLAHFMSVGDPSRP